LFLAKYLADLLLPVDLPASELRFFGFLPDAAITINIIKISESE
jgi:hypothetical protein